MKNTKGPLNNAIFRTIVEQSPISTQIFSPKGDTIFVNKAWEDLWGINFSTLSGYNILQDKQLEELGLMKYIKEGFAGKLTRIPAAKYEPQKTLPGASNVDFKWVHAVIYPITDEEGNIQEVILQHEDITARKEDEERIKSHQERLELAQEAAEIGTYERNLETGEVTWTPQIERLYGYEKGSLANTYEAWSKHVHIEDLAEVTKGIKQATQTKKYLDIEFRIKRKDKKIRWMAAKARTIYDEQGKPIKHIGINMDITKRKEWEDKLRESESKFRQLFESNIIGIFTSTFDGKFLDANDAFLDMIGYTRKELTSGKIHRDVITPQEYREKSKQAVADLRKTGTTVPYEKVYTHKNGKQIHILVAVTRIGDTDTCIGYVLDISERKNLEMRKDEFISMASHELKTPVTSLKIFTQTLIRQLKKNNDNSITPNLERMNAQIDKLTRLISDLLDVSKINTGKFELRKETFHIDDLVIDVADNLQAVSKRKIVVKNGLNVQVTADKDRIGQVVVNLINNALKYSPKEKAVTITVEPAKEGVKVSVIDQGKGIAKEYQDKIFERFYQAPEAAKHTYPGLGLGLYISQEIIKLHNGRIDVKSEEGKGATFSFTIPLEPS